MGTLARRLARLERSSRPESSEPQAVVYLPCNSRGDKAPRSFWVGTGLVVIYLPGGDGDPHRGART